MAIHSEATTIKLCGREFVRAVVFACGGSRWRRQLGDPFSEGLIGKHMNCPNIHNFGMQAVIAINLPLS